jgi:hypothetical protein
MQILFAAPFLLAAGLVFTVLSVIPRARQWGIPIPTGIIAAGPSFLLALLTEGLLVNWLAPAGTWERWHPWLVLAAIGGIAGGLIAGFLAWVVVQLLPELLLPAAVFIAAWCSYFVVLVAAEIASSHFGFPRGGGLIVLVLEALLSFIGAFLIAKRSEEFRPRKFRLPWGNGVSQTQ